MTPPGSTSSASGCSKLIRYSGVEVGSGEQGVYWAIVSAESMAGVIAIAVPARQVEDADGVDNTLAVSCVGYAFETSAPVRIVTDAWREPASTLGSRRRAGSREAGPQHRHR
jgi:hypothetical protein